MGTCEKKSCCAGDAAVLMPRPTAAPVADAAELLIRIEQMDCPTEERLLRGKLTGMPGIEALDFNLMQRRLTVRHRSADTGDLLEAIRSLGMDPHIDGAAPGAANGARTLFIIENMDCPTEEGLIRTRLGSLPQVQSLQFNLMQHKLEVEHTGAVQDIEHALKAIGMHAVQQLDGASPPPGTAAGAPSARGKWIRAIAGLAAAGAAEVMAWSDGTDASVTVIALALIAIGISGLGTYKKGWIALRNKSLNINALMTIAVTGAILIGQWPEAAMVMTLFTIAELIEAMSLDRARNAIRSLMAMTPENATVQQADGQWIPVPAASVKVGAVARVAPGERIALDGIITAGQSSVNQAPITGESMPVSKGVGDKVFAGTINEHGSFEYRVSAVIGGSTIARIIKAVEEAQGSRAPTQRFVDRFSAIYTPAVFALALAVALISPLAFGMSWTDALYQALVLLVIACPCALVISTPVTVVSGLAAGARAGILIKGGAYLEQGKDLKVLALDKTGTLTRGVPEVTDVIDLSGNVAQALQIAASLAARSDHPVSTAVHRHWKARIDAPALSEVSNFEALAGRGTKGTIDGQDFYLGNHRLVEQLGVCNEQTEAHLATLEALGKSVVVVCSVVAPLAVFGVADDVRETSREALAQLKSLGIRTIMLSGDNSRTAAAIADKVGIDDARGDLLPEDKLAVIAAELERYKTVGMVGDGINDAPALAKASIGFAMGAAGTDTAIETADIALMDDDLRRIADFVRLSRRAGAVLRQNIVIALSIKAVFLGLTMFGAATLWMAVFADMGASLIVVFNGLRLLKAEQA